MSEERHQQWGRRLDRLHSLREHHARMGRYDRAHRAYLTIQQVYDRWAEEIFAA
jgi:hypothetical protein